MKFNKYPDPYLWKPKNIKKYTGDPNNIWVRSSYEKKVFKWMDNNPNVISWASEEKEFVVPYFSPIDNKWHKYYPDILAKMKTKSGIVTYLIEIKPYAQTIEPTPKKRVTKSYINEVYTWGINSSKWKAAKEYCIDRNWKFLILTERDIF